MGAALRGDAARHGRGSARVPTYRGYPPLMTTTDITADDVVWDLTPLLPAPDDEGLAVLLDRAGTGGVEVAGADWGVAFFYAADLTDFMRRLGEVHEIIG